MKKKVLAIMLAASMVFSMTGCSGSGGGKTTKTDETISTDTKAEETSTGQESTGGFVLDGTWPAETVKIGVVAYDVTDEQFLAMQKYYEDLKNYFNIDFMYSESIASAEDELKFIENCSAAGCDAVMGYYNVTEAEVAQLCADVGMYYWGSSEKKSVYDKLGSNEYYLGSPDSGDADYENGYALANVLIEQGAKKIVYASGGDEMGVTMFINRYMGFQDAVGKADDVKLVHKVPGWPGTDSFTAEQTAVLDMDFDALASSFSAAVWFQPLASAGKLDGSIKIATVGNVSDVYHDAMNDGFVSAIIYECEEVVFGNAIPMILNAVTGHVEANRNEEGTAANFSVPRWTIDSADIYNTIYDAHEENKWFVTPEDIANCLVEYNNEANYSTLVDTYGSLDIDTAMEKVK